MPDNYPLSAFNVQDNKTTNQRELTEIRDAPVKGRLLCLDLGTRKVGLAVSDEIQLTVRPVRLLKRTSWKTFLKKISQLVGEFDAAALVIGLPLAFEGGESEMSEDARAVAEKFSLSLDIPVYLHDERLSTYTARGHLWKTGKKDGELRDLLDAESAAVILSDFIETRNQVNSRSAPRESA